MDRQGRRQRDTTDPDGNLYCLQGGGWQMLRGEATEFIGASWRGRAGDPINDVNETGSFNTECSLVESSKCSLR